MIKSCLALAFTAAALNCLSARLGERIGIEMPRFLALGLCLPAVLLGIRSWWRVNSITRCWPVVVCALIAWAGLTWADETDSNRGLYLAGVLTMVLPLAALIIQNRCWWFCAKVYVAANLLAVVLVAWLQAGGIGGLPSLLLGRFGLLISSGEHRALTNPNQFGAQLAFAALAASVLYLRGNDPRLPKTAGSERSNRLHFAAAFVLAVGCILSGSRGAFVALAGGMSILLIWGTVHLSPSRLRGLVVLGISGTALAVLVSIAGASTPWERLYQRFAKLQTDSPGMFGTRSGIWLNAFEAWSSEPKYWTLGTGTGKANEVLGENNDAPGQDRYGAVIRSCHSTFVHWGFSYGLLGTAAGVCLLVVVARQAILLDRRDRTVNRRAILVCVALFSMTGVTYQRPDWLATGSLLLAMLGEMPVLPPTKPRKPDQKSPVADEPHTDEVSPHFEISISAGNEPPERDVAPVGPVLEAYAPAERRTEGVLP